MAERLCALPPSLPPSRYQHSFHSIDLSALRGAAVEEYFRQPIKVCAFLPLPLSLPHRSWYGANSLQDTFDVRILMAKPMGHTTDFTTAEESQLLK